MHDPLLKVYPTEIALQTVISDSLQRRGCELCPRGDSLEITGREDQEGGGREPPCPALLLYTGSIPTNVQLAISAESFLRENMFSSSYEYENVQYLGVCMRSQGE